jgi:hypothetical protein
LLYRAFKNSSPVLNRSYLRTAWGQRNAVDAIKTSHDFDAAETYRRAFKVAKKRELG